MIEIEIESADWTTSLPHVEARTRSAAEAALDAVALQGDLVILLSDDDAVQTLNARFRDRDRPTNVLSFPAPDGARPHLGDVALAFGVCAREAQAQGKTLADHLTHLVVHGVLHLAGRNHEAEDEAVAMEGEERAILARLGVADPYAGEHG